MKSSIVLLLCILMTAACGQKVNFGLPAADDNFGQNVTYNNKVDIIWIVDNSSSMQAHQSALSAQVPSLVSKLNSLKMDYHMGVITTSMGAGGDGGKLIGSPATLTSSTPNLANVLSQRLVVGQDGDNLERGIDSLISVLSPAYLNTPEGSSFFRSDALLVVVALSDEDDHSARSLSYMTNFLDTVKPRWSDGSRSWMFSFVGVLELSAVCRTFNTFSDPGLFYIDLANASNGSVESICSTDYTTTVSNIRARILQILTDFKLSNIPVVSSIKVSINGMSVPQSAMNGWTYESAGNLVRFHGTAVPAADAAIKVNFDPAQAN